MRGFVEEAEILIIFPVALLGIWERNTTYSREVEKKKIDGGREEKLKSDRQKTSWQRQQESRRREETEYKKKKLKKK